jgi:hypothetical protein
VLSFNHAWARVHKKDLKTILRFSYFLIATRQQNKVVFTQAIKLFIRIAATGDGGLKRWEILN